MYVTTQLYMLVSIMLALHPGDVCVCVGGGGGGHDDDGWFNQGDIEL